MILGEKWRNRIFNFLCMILLDFCISPWGREKIGPCKVGRDEKSLKSNELNEVYTFKETQTI